MQNKECALSSTSKTTEKESGGHNTMICKKIDISVDSYQETAALYTYFLDNSPEMIPDRKRPLVLICPGGGYEMTSDREAEPVAIQYIAKGYQAAILRYSVKPAKYPLMYEVSDVLVINKIDALPVFDFRKDYVEACARRLNPQIKIFYISAKTGEGVKELADYLLEKIQEVNA